MALGFPLCRRPERGENGPVLSPQQALDHPHIRAAGFVQAVDYPGLPKSAPVARAAVRLSETLGDIARRPPTLGEHTDVVLAKLGYDKAAIAALRESDVIQGARQGMAALRQRIRIKGEK